jgi:hypothetical protein
MHLGGGPKPSVECRLSVSAVKRVTATISVARRGGFLSPRAAYYAIDSIWWVSEPAQNCVILTLAAYISGRRW